MFAGSIAAGHGRRGHRARWQPGSHPNRQPKPSAPRFCGSGGILFLLGIAFSPSASLLWLSFRRGEFPRGQRGISRSVNTQLRNILGICLLHPPGWGLNQQSPLLPKDFPLPWRLHPRAALCLPPQRCWRTLSWVTSSPRDSHGQIYTRNVRGRGDEPAEI